MTSSRRYLAVLWIALLLFVLQGCTQINENANRNADWGGYAAEYQKFFNDNYLSSSAMENIYDISLLDLDENEIPELLVYSNGGAIWESIAIYTIENGEICCFTKEIPYGDELKVSVPTSKNAIFYWLGGVSFQNLLLKNDYPTYAEDFKLGSYILKYHQLNADNDEWIFVNSYTTEVSPADVGKTHIVRQFLRFFSENGALAAEPLFQYDTISVEGVIESWKTGNKTGKEAEEAIAAYNEWFWSAYAPVWNIDYGQLSMKLDSGMKEAAANTFFITFQTS